MFFNDAVSHQKKKKIQNDLRDDFIEGPFYFLYFIHQSIHDRQEANSFERRAVLRSGDSCRQSQPLKNLSQLGGGTMPERSIKAAPSPAVDAWEATEPKYQQVKEIHSSLPSAHSASPC